MELIEPTGRTSKRGNSLHPKELIKLTELTANRAKHSRMESFCSKQHTVLNSELQLKFMVNKCTEYFI